MTRTAPPAVYLSYSRADGAEAAEGLRIAFADQGVSSWLDTRDIDPFQDFTAELERNIESASHVLICLTPDTKRPDSFVRREIQYALLLHKPIVPVRFTDIIPHISIVNYEWVDYFRNPKAGLSQLLTIVRGSGRQTAESTTVSDPFRPYVEMLYRRTVTFLQQTVLSLIDLEVSTTPGQVVAPSRRLDMIGQFFVGQGFAGTAHGETRFGTFHDAFDHYQGRVLLLGDPGSGKTITLMAHARDAAVAWLADSSEPLPLLGLIPTWNAVERTSLADWLADGYHELSPEAVRDVLAHGSALLLLDGLDELGDEQIVWEDQPSGKRRVVQQFDPRIRFIQLIPARHKILVTCRVKDYTTLKKKVALNGAVTLLALTDEQIAAYLRDQPHLRAAARSDPALHEMLRTPLVMSLFGFAYRDMSPEDADRAADLAKSPAELRDSIILRYITKRYEWEARKHSLAFTLEEVLRRLGRLALFDASRRWSHNIIQGIPPQLGELAFQLNVLVRSTGAPTALDRAIGPEGARSSSDEYRFTHLLIRDVLVYRAAIEAVGKSADEEIAINALVNMPDQRSALALHHFTASAVDRTRYLAIAALIARRRDVSADALSNWSTLASSLTREATAEIIAEGGYLELDALLIHLLADATKEVRARAAQSLGRLCVTAALEPLLHQLDDSDSVVRANTVYALSRLGGDKVVTTVAGLLDDRSPLVRLNAEIGLMRIDTEKARSSLSNWRRSQNRH